jgi:hypothetical protein
VKLSCPAALGAAAAPRRRTLAVALRLAMPSTSRGVVTRKKKTPSSQS